MPQKLWLPALVCTCLVSGCEPVPPAKTPSGMNLKQIGLAFHNHHDTWKAFPHASGTCRLSGDEEDRYKMGLSWRVHLLPFLGQEALYNKFNLDEPWDGPTNKSLVNEMPDVYTSYQASKDGHTTFHVVVSVPTTPEEKTIFPKYLKGSLPGAWEMWDPRIRNCTDGTSNTVLVIECDRSTETPWTKPGGIELGHIRSALPKHQPSFLTVMADGAVRQLRSDLSTLDNFEILFTSQDGRSLNELLDRLPAE